MSRNYIKESFTLLPLFVDSYPYADKLYKLLGPAEGSSNLQPTLLTVTYVLLNFN
jgi:hypothetical protein